MFVLYTTYAFTRELFIVQNVHIGFELRYAALRSLVYINEILKVLAYSYTTREGILYTLDIKDHFQCTYVLCPDVAYYRHFVL